MDQTEVLEKELDRLLQWVRAAESRLALVLPLSTAMLAALAVFIPESFDRSVSSYVAAPIALLFLALSILFCAFATFPRTSGPKGSLIYFGGIESLELDKYSAAVKSLSEDEYIDDLISQCHRNAQIAAKKYGWVQKSMACLFLAAVPWVVALSSLYREP